VWMSTLVSIFFNFVSIFAFSYVLWKKLKEDYHHDTIFKFTLTILAGAGAGWWVGESWAKDFVFWLVFAGGGGAGYIYLRRLNLKFFEVIDAISLGTFYFLFLHYLGRSIILFALPNYFFIANASLSVLLIFLYVYLARDYRGFRWYPSGKVGFAGLFTLSLFFLGHGLGALVKHFQDPVIFFQYSPLSLSVEVINVIIPLGLMADIIISLTLFGILTKVLYVRSGRG